MGIYKRVLLYLIRKKGRSFLLFTIILLLACFIFVGKVLSQRAQNEIDSLARNLGSSFVLKVDENNPAFQETQVGEGYVGIVYVGPRITDELVSEILELDHVTDYETTRETFVWTDLNFKPAMWANSEESEFITQETIELYRQSPRLFICTKGELSRNFRIGALSITSGRNIQKGDQSVALISEYLAMENQLTIGDTITLETKRGIYESCENPFEKVGECIEVEIIGIFSLNFKQEESPYTAEEDYADNFIYVDYDTGREIFNNLGLNNMDSYGEVTFFVDAPEYLPEIMQQIENQVDIEDLLLYQDDTAYQASAKPLKQIRIIAHVLSGMGIAGCAWILYLVFVMWIKGRRQEIGILLSIGVNKREILMQMLLECFVITTLALIIAIVLSKPLAEGCGNIAEHLMTTEAAEETYKIERDMMSPSPVIEKISSEPVKLDGNVSVQDIVFLMIAAYCISFGSVWIAAARIARFNPKELLQSM